MKVHLRVTQSLVQRRRWRELSALSPLFPGDYASESEVIREGLRALQARDRAIETWLQTEVVHAYDAMAADPTRGLSLQEVRAHLAQEHDRATAKA